MKFEHFIKLITERTMPDRDKIYNNIMSQKRGSFTKTVAIICAVVIALAAIGAGGYFGLGVIKLGKENHLPDELLGISPITAITAKDTVGDTVLPNSPFEVTTQEVMSASELQEVIKISPKSDYTVKKTSGNTFDIVFDESLKDGTLYTMSSVLGSKTVYSWAFETQKKFEITASVASGGGSVHYLETSEIWVEFSHSDVKNFEQYFSITPAVSGTFEQYGRRWVFIPSSDFAKSTVYTVTVSKDIICGDGQTLDSDYSFNIFSLVGGAYAQCVYNDKTMLESFTPEQTPVATLQYSNVDISNASVSVYSTDSASTFANVHKAYVKNGLISSAIAEKLKTADLTFEAQPLKYGSTDKAYITYPQTLEPGFYISKIDIGDISTYHIFEVTSLAVYTMSADSSVTVWVNDLETKQPLANVGILSEDGKLVTTDANGVAVVECSGGGIKYLSIGTQTPYVAIVTTKQSKATDAFCDYYSYIYASSGVYRAGDTVKLWGFTLPRLSETAAATEVELKCGWNGEKIALTPDSDGAFSTEVVIDGGAADQNGYVDLLIDGELADTVYFDLYSESPTYNVEITTDKSEYVAGETVTYNIYATLYDGTPAENVSVTMGDTEAVTNSRGLATLTETAEATDGREVLREFAANGQAYYVKYTVYEQGVVIGDVYRENGGTLSVALTYVDSAIAAEQTDVTAELYKIEYTPNLSFAEYNGVTQSERVTTVFNVDSTLQSTNTVTAINGIAQIPITENDHSYYYLIKAGNSEYVYYEYGELLEFYRNDHHYSLECKSEYVVGDTVNARLCGITPENEVSEGKVLISFITDGVLKSEVFDASNISFEFLEQFAPDVTLAGAYFDGVAVSSVALKTVAQKKAPLAIDVTADKESYAPGDTVTLKISASNAATLNVNVHDSRLLDFEDITQSVYESKSRDTAIYRSTSTYIPSIPSDKKSAEEDVKLTANMQYRESPYFETVKTDSEGNATVSFTLPDTVGRFTVSVCGYDQNANVGKTEFNIDVTSQMYLDTFIADEIDITSDLSFAFRFDGTDITEDCSYTAALLKDGIQIATLTGSAKPQQVKNESFGRLSAQNDGSYTIKITGTSGSLSCESEKELTLTQGTEYQTEILLQNSTDIDSSLYNSDIAISVYDTEYELYFKVIEKMLEKTDSRIDHRLASSISQSIVSGKSIAQEDLQLISGCATSQGIYIYPGSSLALCSQAALIAITADDLFDQSTVKEYFTSVLKNKPDTLSTISANAALASMGEPVLSELNTLYDGISGYTDEQKLFLALGFTCAGDYNRAYEILNSGLLLKIQTANGISTFEADTPAATEYMSCIAAIVTSKLSQKDAKDLVKGLMNASDSTLTGLAYCTFIKECVPYLEGKNTIEFRAADGKITEISYNRTEHVTFNIAREDIGKVGIASVTGESASCIAASKALDTSDYSQVLQKMSEIAAQSTAVNDGDTVGLTLTLDTVGCNMAAPYAVIDIPHGLKLLDASVTGGTATVAGNTIYMSTGTVTVELSCYAAVEGAYTVFAPTVIDRKSGQYIAGDSVEIIIN